MHDTLKPFFFLIGLVLILCILLPGCTTQSPPSGTPVTTGTPTQGGSLVTIQNSAFHPADLLVARGTTVTWTNADSIDHRIWNGTPYEVGEGTLFKSDYLAEGDTYSFQFTAPGEYIYHCGIHPAEHGKIVVT